MQQVEGLYCVGDSCFPGQGVIAVAFSGIMCGHRVAADLGEFLYSLNENKLQRLKISIIFLQVMRLVNLY